MASVLVVDDDLLYRSLMVEALRLDGNKVQEAHSKASALRILGSQTKFDVALCDLQMDGLDGLDLIKIIKSEHPHVAIIVVSAHSSEGGVGETARHYAAEYLSKPFSIVKLINTVKRTAQIAAQRA